MFKVTSDRETIEENAKLTGNEEAGTDLTRFLLKEEFETHIEIIHGGKREYWNKVNDARRMAKVRKLDSLNKGIRVSTSQKGSGKKE